MEPTKPLERFLTTLTLLSSHTQNQSDKLLLIEHRVKQKLAIMLERDIYSAGSQLIGLLMFDSDLDVAIVVNDEGDLQNVLEVLKKVNFEFEPFTDESYDGIQFGVCYSTMEGVKVDVQLRSRQNILDLEKQVAELPQWSEKELTLLRQKKILARAIGGATYVNWKHDFYRTHLPALILSTPRRTKHEMCQSHNTSLQGQCTKRASVGKFCNLHKKRGE